MEKVSNEVGPSRVAAVVTDNAANTRPRGTYSRQSSITSSFSGHGAFEWWWLSVSNLPVSVGQTVSRAVGFAKFIYVVLLPIVADACFMGSSGSSRTLPGIIGHAAW
jgi:hypothetical protein